METRFSVVKIENAKRMVRDAHTGGYVWNLEYRTREEARRFARSRNNKERLRTAKIVSVDGEPIADYLARIAREAHEKRQHDAPRSPTEA